MKYYYEGKLMRTSNHVYTHAVIDGEGNCIACRNGYENAEKAKSAYYNRRIKEYTDAIKALEAGKDYYYYKRGNLSYKHVFNKQYETVEMYLDEIKKATDWNEKVNGWQIVKLESR